MWRTAQSSLSSSAASCIPRRATRLSGWMNSAASITAASTSHAGSRRTTWASSWASIASCCRASRSSARVGTTISRLARAIGERSTGDSVNRTCVDDTRARVISRCSRSRRTPCVSASRPRSAPRSRLASQPRRPSDSTSPTRNSPASTSQGPRVGPVVGAGSGSVLAATTGASKRSVTT